MGGEKGGGRATFGGEGPLRVRITERPNKEHGKMSVQKEMSWGYSGGILLQVSHCVQPPCAFFTRLQRKVLRGVCARSAVGAIFGVAAPRLALRD